MSKKDTFLYENMYYGIFKDKILVQSKYNFILHKNVPLKAWNCILYVSKDTVVYENMQFDAQEDTFFVQYKCTSTLLKNVNFEGMKLRIICLQRHICIWKYEVCCLWRHIFWCCVNAPFRKRKSSLKQVESWIQGTFFQCVGDMSMYIKWFLWPFFTLGCVYMYIV